MAQTFDGPTTIKRSGSEHRRAVTSLALLERARAWEWVKDPPAGEGQVGQIQHSRAVTSSLFGQERGLVRDMELSLQERRRGRKVIKRETEGFESISPIQRPHYRLHSCFF